MADKPDYEAPRLTVLGPVTELTQQKPGIFFDAPGSQLGSNDPPAPGTPGTGTSP